MILTREEIQKTIKQLEGEPVFAGSDTFLLFGEIIETNKITNLKDLIQHVFAAGMDCKIREVKNVLNVVDPRN
jgi:hypothetical protein